MLITEYFTSQASHQTGTSVGQIQITTHELNAMCYACGYVPRTLLKRYENKTGPVFSQYVQCLSDMAVEGEDNFDLYTKKWFDLVNRGGLFPLNEKTLMFFAEVEKCVRALLPKHVIHEESDKATFKDVLLKNIVQNEDVQFAICINVRCFFLILLSVLAFVCCNFTFLTLMSVYSQSDGQIFAVV